MQYHFHMRQTAFQPENGLYDQRKKCHMPEPPFRASPDLTSHKNNSGIYFRIPHCGVVTWTALLSIRHRPHYPAAAEDRKPPEDIIKEPPRMGRFFLISSTIRRRTRNHRPSYGLSSRVRLRKVWWCLWDSNPYSVSGSGFSCRSMLPWPRGARVAVWTLSSPYCPCGQPRRAVYRLYAFRRHAPASFGIVQAREFPRVSRHSSGGFPAGCSNCLSPRCLPFHQST